MKVLGKVAFVPVIASGMIAAGAGAGVAMAASAPALAHANTVTPDASTRTATGTDPMVNSLSGPITINGYTQSGDQLNCTNTATSSAGGLFYHCTDTVTNISGWVVAGQTK